MRKLVIVNQAANYLTIGLANAFNKDFDEVVLMTGSIHVQGESLDQNIQWRKIRKWREQHGLIKVWIYLAGLIQIYMLLLFRYRKHEVFFVSLPPMAYLLNIVLPHRFSMLIWDVYPDVLKIAGMKESNFIYKMWARLNRISFQKAYRLFTISDLMKASLSRYVDSQKIFVQPIWSIFQRNGKVDPEQNPFILEHDLLNKFIVQYSGNIGLTHNVEYIVALAEYMQDDHNVLFQIIGRGPRVLELRKLVKQKELNNCQFLPFQSDEMFPYSLSAAQVGVVILDESVGKGSVPSKSYNLMSYGIPSLYIASKDSQLQVYADKYGHAVCLRNDDFKSAKEFILKLNEDKEYYQEVSANGLEAAKNFKRENADNLVKQYLKD